jgi:hypothetical protein
MKPRPRRHSRSIATLAVVSALGVAGCAYSLINGGKVNPTLATNIEHGIAGIRELGFKSHVPLVLKTPDQVEQMVLDDLKRDYTDAQLEADGKAGAMLGLFPPGIDLKSESVKLLKSQIAGFYDPHEKQMVLVEGAATAGFSDRMLEFMVQRDLIDDMLLAHELTHALQDQNFGLQDQLDKLKNNSDEEIALKSVAEGDATLAGFAYIAGRMDNSVAETLTAHLRDLPETFAAQSKDTPEGLSYPLIFQYSEGTRFVSEAYKRGGWRAVDALYLKPPQSSQQIINPAFYFDHPLLPVAVQVAGYQAILKDWSEADADTFGELSVQVILQLGYGKDTAEVGIARKWAGDRMEILSHGGDIGVIWLVAMRDEDSARSFEESYRALLDRTRAATPHHVERRNNSVLVITGAIADQSAVLAPVIWKTSKIGEVQPPAAPAHPLKTDALRSDGLARAE